VTPTPVAEHLESLLLENLESQTQGSSSIAPPNAKKSARKTAPENKVDDSDFEGNEDDEDEDEDEDEDDVDEVKLPPAQNAAGKAKNSRGRQIKSVTPQGKFKLYTYLHCPSSKPSSSKLLRQSSVAIPLGRL
jgi:hypothetical protein